MRLIIGGATLVGGAIASYRFVVIPFMRGDAEKGPPDPDAVLMLRSITGAAGALGLAALLAGLIWRWMR
jgi:hypothetical protein